MRSRSVWERLDALPRVHLAQLPTPLHPAAATNGGNGPALWLKRDDLISFGFGGNKVRGLELLLADAQRVGADRLITGAGVQSNHVRATAAAAAWARLDMTAVYWGEPPDRREGNYLLVDLLDGQATFTGSTDRSTVDLGIEAEAERARTRGETPYAIPRGGACPLGVAGHILAARELAWQCDALGIEPSAIVLAVGSGTTLAGWMMGARLLDRPWRFEAITVSRPADEVRSRVATLSREAARMLEIDVTIGEREVVVHDEFIGAGYGVPTEAGEAAIALAARRLGVFLDPTYTGKAFAGYLAFVARRRFTDGTTVIFLHTGGEPALFAHAEPRR